MTEKKQKGPICKICNKEIKDWTKEGMLEPIRQFWIHQNCVDKVNSIQDLD